LTRAFYKSHDQIKKETKTMFSEKHGYVMFEVVSALQKSIRRGDEESAMWWALEMLPRYESWMWRRLMVIAQEDIGLAAPDVVQFVTGQCNAWFTMRDLGAKGECRLVLANTILAMCRAHKSRLADHFQAVVSRLHHVEKRSIPDHALDKHTLRGKQMGRGVEHWLLEGAHLENENGTHDPYQDAAWEIWENGEMPPEPDWPKPSKNREKLIEQLSLL
jgi:replication-associated recombination protein RarA